MSPANTASDPELALWERVFVPDPQHITPEQARYLLGIRFLPADQERIHALSAKAGEGTLTPEERADLDRYIHVGHLLSILKAKVRLRLKETRDPSIRPGCRPS